MAGVGGGQELPTEGSGIGMLSQVGDVTGAGGPGSLAARAKGRFGAQLQRLAAGQ